MKTGQKSAIADVTDVPSWVEGVGFQDTVVVVLGSRFHGCIEEINVEAGRDEADYG